MLYVILCAVCYFVLCMSLYCTVLYWPVLYCSTVPPGINSFEVNNNTDCPGLVVNTCFMFG